MLKLLPFQVINHRLFSSVPSEIKLITFERKLEDCSNLAFKELVKKVHTDEKLRIIFQVFFEKNTMEFLLDPKIQERLVSEFDVFLNHKEDYLLDYLLHYEDIAYFYESQNIIANIGRGACVASLTNYLLRITKVNPLDYNLLFERWLNKESAPDIDMDTPDSRMVQEYLKQKYPDFYKKVQVENKWRIKPLLSECRDALGLSLESKKFFNEIVTKHEELFLMNNSPKPLKTQLDLFNYLLEHNASFILIFSHHPEVKELFLKKLDTVRDVRDHTVAFVLSDTNKLLMQDVDKEGIVKFDILQLTTLDELNIKMSLKDFKEIKSFEPKVLNKLFSSNREQKGVTYSTSKFFPNFKVQTIEDVAILIAKGRPHNNLIQDYLVYKGRNPIIIKYLEETNGEAVFQEQLMQIFAEAMNIDLYESRAILRSASKGEIDQDESFLNAFSQSDQVFLKGASQYAFLKAHAIAYAITDYCLFK